jgi:ABC-2 type transport system ATP-binding protein
MLVFGPNERSLKAEAKKQLEYWFERLESDGGTRNPRAKGMAQKIQFVVCVLHKPKLLILMSLFWF